MEVNQTSIMRRLRRKRRKKLAAVIAGIASGALAVIIAIAFCLRAADRFTVTTGDEPGLALVSGYDMAKSRNVPFAAAGWAYDIPEIRDFLKNNCPLYFDTPDALYRYLFSEGSA